MASFQRDLLAVFNEALYTTLIASFAISMASSTDFP